MSVFGRFHFICPDAGDGTEPAVWLLPGPKAGFVLLLPWQGVAVLFSDSSHWLIHSVWLLSSLLCLKSVLFLPPYGRQNSWLWGLDPWWASSCRLTRACGSLPFLVHKSVLFLSLIMSSQFPLSVFSYHYFFFFFNLREKGFAFIFILSLQVLWLNVCMCTLGMQCPQKPERALDSPGANSHVRDANGILKHTPTTLPHQLEQIYSCVGLALFSCFSIRGSALERTVFTFHRVNKFHTF